MSFTGEKANVLRRGESMLKSKKFNIVLATDLAVVLWAYVLGEINPTYKYEYHQRVPINSLMKKLGSRRADDICSTSAQTVNIHISGQRTDITPCRSRRLYGYSDVEALHNGENTVRLTVTGRKR